jgi:hypothetical protein
MVINKMAHLHYIPAPECIPRSFTYPNTPMIRGRPYLLPPTHSRLFQEPAVALSPTHAGLLACEPGNVSL